MKRLLYPSVLPGFLLAGALALSTAARAETISQTNQFDYETPISGYGDATIVDPSFFNKAFDPWTDYGPSNALTSFTITWDVSLTAGGFTAGPGQGGFNGGGGGSYEVDGVTYGNSHGGSFSALSGSGGVIFPQSASVTNTFNFAVSDAGVTYDPAILADIMSGPILDWDATYTLNYGGLTSGDAGALGYVILTYSTDPVPEPGSLALAGTGALAFLAWRKRRRAAA